MTSFIKTLLSLIVLSVASIFFSCKIGSVPISITEIFSSFYSTDLTHNIVQLRLDRALTSFVTGASLALAGLIMQALLRNPLADPYILGVSSGAAVGALFALLLSALPIIVTFSAMGGALGISLLLYIFAQRDFGQTKETTLLLLTGVILSSICMAIVTLILSIAPDHYLRNMIFWMIGDIANIEFSLIPWYILIISLIFTLSKAKAINTMSLFGNVAYTLGISVNTLRLNLFIITSLLTATTVSNVGSIGFIGLIIPHACRFIWKEDHRLLIPFSTLIGGIFLVWADTLARTLFAPQQIPVGVITALIGAPIFLIQLYHIRRHAITSR